MDFIHNFLILLDCFSDNMNLAGIRDILSTGRNTVDDTIIPIIHRPYNNIILSFLFLYCFRATKKRAEMIDFLQAAYPWTKSLHVISVIAWMAGLFYLPRLFVYHVERVGSDSDLDDLFQTMEVRLLRAIMNPAMVFTWVFGLALVFTPGVVDWSAVWPYAKAAAVLAMTWFHHWLGLRRKDFAAAANTRSGRTYRMMNELPTLLMIVIVISVIARPF